jgi:hypothetical protein
MKTMKTILAIILVLLMSVPALATWERVNIVPTNVIDLSSKVQVGLVYQVAVEARRGEELSPWSDFSTPIIIVAAGTADYTMDILREMGLIVLRFGAQCRYSWTEATGGPEGYAVYLRHVDLATPEIIDIQVTTPIISP